MSPAAFLDTAQSIGVTLWDESGVLRYRGPREAVEKVVPMLKAHKPAILAALARASSEVSELKEMFDGCARILEHLEVLPRADAELEAARIAATLARNRGYLWASLRAALADYPELLTNVGGLGLRILLCRHRTGPVASLPFGPAKVVVLKNRCVVRQGTFTGAQEAHKYAPSRSVQPTRLHVTL